MIVEQATQNLTMANKQKKHVSNSDAYEQNLINQDAEQRIIELTSTQTERRATQSSSSYSQFKKKERRRPAIRGSIQWSKLPAKPLSGSVFETDGTITIPNSPLIDVIALSLLSGQITVLSGKNGTGKTKLMAELANPRSQILKREKGTQTAYLPLIWPREVLDGTVKDFFRWVKDLSNPHSEVSPSQLQSELRRLGLGNGKASPLNVLLERSGNETTMGVTKTSPLDLAKQTIEEARKLGKRAKIS